MHRFFVENSQSNLLTLSERESHHATNVLRVKQGERVVVLDGKGGEILCEVENPTARKITLKVLQRTTIPPLPYQLVLVQALPKGKAMDLIVQKAAELGAYRIVPLISERSVTQIEEENAAAKVEKWDAIAIDAIKQCGSTWLPRIEPPCSPQAFIAKGERFDLALVATLQNDRKHPREYIRNHLAERGGLPKSIAVWVGPEGDFTPAEINAIRASGALPITLGELILRSETAAIFCLSVLNYELQAPHPE